MSNDLCLNVRITAAENSDTQKELTKMVKDRKIRCDAAKNTDTPKYILKKLAKDPDPNVRRTAKRNKNF